MAHAVTRNEIDELVAEARSAAQSAYAPYSRFRVGAAIRFTDGTIVRGCNVENRSFGLTICAERAAMFTAVTSGHTRPTAIAIACVDAGEPVSPCGACRQVLSEFSSADCPVIFVDGPGKRVLTTIGELIPYDSLQDFKART